MLTLLEFPISASNHSLFVYGSNLLLEGIIARAGQVETDSTFYHDLYFVFRRHSIQPNAVQWYTLFSLSPLSPRIHDGWGKFPPPPYLSQQRNIVQEAVDAATKYDVRRYSVRSSPQEEEAIPSVLSSLGKVTRQESLQSHQLLPHMQGKSHLSQVCAPFSNYIINPIPINEILLMRVREGYYAKQYGQNMIDNDRLSLLFTLPLDMGISIRYELSYKSLAGQDSNLFGFAHIKIELVGDSVLIWSIKKDFLNNQNSNQGGDQMPTTSAQQISAKICTYLRWIRKEDLLQSYLSPPKWSDQLSSSKTPFIRRLSTLSPYQRQSHFCWDEFDCVCVGQMPWDDDDFLSEFRDTDDGSQQLVDAVEEWTNQTVVEGRHYVKQTHSDCGVAGYAVVSLNQSPLAPRLYTVVLETFSGISAASRQLLLASIKSAIQSLKAVEVLSKQFCKSLVMDNTIRRLEPERRFHQSVLECHQNHATWDLVKDPELTPLLMKRRKEIGGFFLLESSDKSSFFVRLFDNETRTAGLVQDPGNMAQYQFAVLEDKVVVDFYMESESGVFSSFRTIRAQQINQSKFHRLVRSLKKRDQECGHALRCRTTLLQAFSTTELSFSEEDKSLTYLSSVQRLLGYTSKVVLRLRFFHPGSGEANSILQALTRDTLLSQSFGPKVAELPISTMEWVVQTLDDGYWFVVEYDKYTSSIVHLSNHSKSHDLDKEYGRSLTYREMTFFTFCVSDVSCLIIDLENVSTKFLTTDSFF
jgi:hypothetical protein